MIARPRWRYRLYGLLLDSAIELPELVAIMDRETADVRIDPAPAWQGEGARVGDKDAAAGLVLSIEGVANFHMTSGQRIWVQPEPDASSSEIRLFLLGSAFAGILHQRGLLPLHSNVVEVDGHAIGFVGHSGAGKSTLAAWFHDRGYRVLSDDVCVVKLGVDGRPRVYPGVPRLRLWSDALEATGRFPEDGSRVAPEVDKYVVRTASGSNPAPAELKQLYVIRGEVGVSPEKAVLTRVGGARAVQLLIENTYRGSYVRSLGTARQNMEQCAAIVRSLPIFELSRPWSLDRLDDVGAALTRHILEVASARVNHANEAVFQESR